MQLRSMPHAGNCIGSFKPLDCQLNAVLEASRNTIGLYEDYLRHTGVTLPVLARRHQRLCRSLACDPYPSKPWAVEIGVWHQTLNMVFRLRGDNDKRSTLRSKQVIWYGQPFQKAGVNTLGPTLVGLQ